MIKFVDFVDLFEFLINYVLLGCLCVLTKSMQGAKMFLSEASKPPAGARISKGPVGPLKF